MTRRGTKLGHHYQVTRRIRRQLQVNWRHLDVGMARPLTRVVWRRAVLQKVPGVAMSQRVRPNVPAGCQLCPFLRQLCCRLHPPPGRCPVGLDQSPHPTPPQLVAAVRAVRSFGSSGTTLASFPLPRRARRVGRSDSKNRSRFPAPTPLAPAVRCAIRSASADLFGCGALRSAPAVGRRRACQD